MGPAAVEHTISDGKKLDTVITSVDMFIGKYWNVLSFLI
jgi:hypothetical protein